jgi:hypothetical protein
MQLAALACISLYSIANISISTRVQTICRMRRISLYSIVNIDVGNTCMQYVVVPAPHVSGQYYVTRIAVDRHVYAISCIACISLYYIASVHVASQTCNMLY